MTVRFTKEGDIVEVVLCNESRRNALSYETLDALHDSVRAAALEGARCIVVSAEGPVFSAGADFADLSGTAADMAFDAAVSRVTVALRRSPVPVVSVVAGPCLGAAVDLVASTDLVVAASDARFEVPAVRLGILYNPDALAVLRSRVSGGLMRALMFGMSVSASDAAAGGLVARVADSADLPTVVAEITDRLVAAQPAALGATKELLAALDAGRFDREVFQARREQLLGSPERFEAIAGRKQPRPL
ncbi:MAG: enoyl-CoA hydratase/isomerase family protein [Microthrixaceae bacterium]|nr:enoyl-CoA hydratase/isomerase family protein [Microthrixaceae bacterium]